MTDDPFALTVTAPTFDLHEEDEWYEGEVADIEYDPEGRFGPQFIVKYKLDADNEGNEGDPRLIFDWRPAKLTTDDRNRMGKWLKGMTGEKYDEHNPPPNIRTFIGERVKVMFERYTPQSGKNAGVENEKVERVKAA